MKLTFDAVRCLLLLFDKWVDPVMTQSKYRVAVRVAVNDNVVESRARREGHRLRYT